jgi:hypothetical protein
LWESANCRQYQDEVILLIAAVRESILFEWSLPLQRVIALMYR